MPTPANSLNINQTGFQSFDGTATFLGRTLVAGTGVSITNGNGVSGNPTISSTSGGINWVDQTTASVTMAVNTGYTADAGASLITFTLPTSAALGDLIIIQGKAAGLYTINYTTGQDIVFGVTTSTVTSGNVTSNKASDCITIRCSTASITAPIFTVISALGTFTVN